MFLFFSQVCVRVRVPIPCIVFKLKFQQKSVSKVVGDFFECEFFS